MTPPGQQPMPMNKYKPNYAVSLWKMTVNFRKNILQKILEKC